VEERLGDLPADVRVLGFSQGGATAARWVERGKRAASDLILWGSLLPEDVLAGLGDSRWHDRNVTLVRGQDDVLVPPDLHAAQLKDLERPRHPLPATLLRRRAPARRPNPPRPG
jgi:predicted esterase